MTTPDAPLSIASNAALTTSTTIALTWTDGLSNGGTNIIDYRIYYDLATGGTSFVILASGVLTQSYSVAGLTAG